MVFVVALYTAAAQGHPVGAGVWAGSALAAAGYGEAHAPVRHLGDAALFVLIGWLVAIGAVARNRRRYLQEAEQQARARPSAAPRRPRGGAPARSGWASPGSCTTSSATTSP